MLEAYRQHSWIGPETRFAGDKYAAAGASAARRLQPDRPLVDLFIKSWETKTENTVQVCGVDPMRESRLWVSWLLAQLQGSRKTRAVSYQRLEVCGC